MTPPRLNRYQKLHREIIVRSTTAAISATVYSSLMASRATRAWYTALWLRLGFLMDLLPPVTWLSGSKSPDSAGVAARV